MTNLDLSRQSFLGAKSDIELWNTRVVIVGLGGGGSHIAQQLAHLGVGKFRLIDPDAIEASNLNRLVGGSQADVDRGTSKVDILARTIRAIRPGAEVEACKRKWQEADALLKDAHVLFGCIDGYQQRDFLEGAARRFQLPYIDIGMDVAEVGPGHFAVAGQVIVSVPGGPCMRCIGFLTPDRLAREENNYGDAGINPQVVWTNGVLASFAVGEFVKLRTPWFPAQDQFVWLELDGNRQNVTPSQQPKFRTIPEQCPHRGGSDGLGDFHFRLNSPGAPV